ncbi:MAG: hypothetical protein FWD09_08635 [Lentimicrobiaceae bacterium]|nr:hypothetical protein [Lentimicrobiaceae bacterium]
MENYNEHYENPFEEKKRPGFLTFLCVLTFIGSGISLLSNLTSPLFAPIFIETLHSSPLFSGAIEIYEQILVTPIWQFYLLAFFCATSIIGAVYMLKMRKIGFHIYVISQLVQMCIGLFIIGGFFKPTVFSVFIVVLFICLYGMYYKRFTELDAEDHEN